MEHIVQFAIGIDDQAIKDRIEETAEKEIIKNIEQQVRNKLFSSSYYRANATANDPLSSFSMNLIDQFFEKNKEKIIEKAALHLAEKLARTKKGKEILNNLNVRDDS